MEAKKTEAFCGEMRRIEQEFETDRVCKEIMENEFKNVILQLPNSLLKDAVLLLRVLKGKLAGKGTQASLSILADK
jgi:diphthamide biosynthesis enzyme Dph1/Dph2-like protein